MKNLVFMFCCALAFAGCGTKVVVPLETSPNVYTINIERTQFFLSGAEMYAKGEAIQIAQDFCSQKSKRAEMLRIETHPTPDGATAAITFECAEAQDGA